MRVLLGDEALELAPGAIACDAAAFEDALAAGRPADALALYRGDLLPGFHLSEASGFERWLDGERIRLRRRAAEAAWGASAVELAQGAVDRAVELARRALELSDGDERAFQRLVSLLDRVGDRAGALRAFEEYRRWLADELGLAPSPETEDLVAAIRERREADASPRIVPPATVEGARPAPATSATRPAEAGSGDPARGASASGGATADGGPPTAPAVGPAIPASPAGVAARPSARAPHAVRRAQRVLVAGAAAVVATAAVAFVITGGLGPVDGEGRAWILVADVENATGEAVFEHSVTYALAVGLGQSPRLYVMPPERIAAALARMRRPGADSALDEALAREIARREGARFVVVPAIARAGDRYEISARLVEPGSGSTLALVTVHADRADEVIEALDRVVKRVRRDAGESALQVARRPAPLPRVTTSSLAALHKFASGARAFSAAHWDEARRLWEEAVALDSAFATAHGSLGMLAYWTNRPEAGEQHFAQALAHAEGLPERERTLLRARVESWRGNRRESIALLRALYLQDTTDIGVLSRLGYDYLRLGRDREGMEVYRRLVALDSLSLALWINLATVEGRLTLYDSAIAHYRHALALAPSALTENSNFNHEFGRAYVLAGMPDSGAAVFRRMLESSDRNAQARGFRSLAFLAMYRGQYTEASALLAEATRLSRATGALLSELRNRLLLAAASAQRGVPREAAAQLDTCFALGVDAGLDPTFVYWMGKALARAGDARRAGLLLERLEARRVPPSPPMTAALEALRGEVLLARGAGLGRGARGGAGRAAAALPHLKRALRADSNAITLESLAHAVATAGDLERAARLYAELEAKPLFGHESQELWRMAPYWLGAIHERRGDAREAARSYARFLELWRDAEASLPVVMDARERLERLQRVRQREGRASEASRRTGRSGPARTPVARPRRSARRRAGVPLSAGHSGTRPRCAGRRGAPRIARDDDK